MKYFLIAGEASGDLHAGNLMIELKKRDPQAVFRFLGGDKMAAAAGVEPVVHYREMAFMGFIAVVRKIADILHIMQKAEDAIMNFRPDKIILVDYPSFNLKVAKYVKSYLPETEVIYYISPKLWAWKSYRIHAIRRYVDRMFTIFPFETEWYAQRRYHVTYVGNPVVDAVSAFLSDGYDREGVLKRFDADSMPTIALLPGSRCQEINACLPKMAAVAAGFPQYKFVIATAPSVDLSLYTPYLSDNVILNPVSTYALLALSQAAIVNSGTATLETALFDIPQIVVYNVWGGRFALMLKDLVIKTKYISLVNIIAGKCVVKELIAHRFTVKNMSLELRKIVSDKSYRAAILRNYDLIRQKLGADNAAQNCADRILG